MNDEILMRIIEEWHRAWALATREIALASDPQQGTPESAQAPSVRAQHL